MKIRYILSGILLMVATAAGAQDCVMPVSVQLDREFSNVPEAAVSALRQSLSRIAAENGFTADASATRLVLTAHCDVLDKSNLPGPPIQTVYNLGVTLYLADCQTQTSYASAYLALDGVGANEVKSYINAFRKINPGKSEVKDLLNRGRAKITEYFDSQYPTIIKEANRLVSVQRYEEALSLLFTIPACTQGGDEAASRALEIYTKNLNRVNRYLLNNARAMWAAGQDKETAQSVCAMLAQIDPESSSFGEASELMNEVKKQVHSDNEFEMRQKYNDEIKLESDRIAAAKAIGVAYGNGQQSTTTNLMWLK